MVDIDPLAPHPPNDTSRNESISALARVERRADSVAALRGDVRNMVTAFVADFRRSPQGQALQAHVGDVQRFVARDPASASGLSAEAMDSLAKAREALVAQVMRDQAAGVFTEGSGRPSCWAVDRASPQSAKRCSCT